jgi:hypothetical protein
MGAMKRTQNETGAERKITVIRVMDLVLGIGITLRLGNIRSKLSVSEFPQT